MTDSRSVAGKPHSPTARSIAAALVLFVAAAAPLAAQTGTSGPPPPPSGPPPGSPGRADGEAAEPYVVGYSALAYDELPPEHRYIATTLPRLLLESLLQVRLHRFSGEERRVRAEAAIEERRRTAVTRLDAAVRRRDALLFAAQTTAAQRETLDAAVAEARAALDAATRLTVADIRTPSQAPIRTWDGHADGRLLEPARASLAPADPGDAGAIARANGLDLLIWGSIEELEGYLAVDLFAYSAAAGASEPVASTVARPEDIAAEADFVAAELAGHLLGREWGTVEVRTNIDDARVFLNSELAGFGDVVLRYLEPGAVRLAVAAPGYRTVRGEAVVTPGETVTLVAELEATDARRVRLESAPAGADVYVNSLWRGRTPLSLLATDEPATVRMTHSGYLDSHFVISSSSPERITRALLPDTIDWGSEIRQKRDAFYGSFSWFVLSVPVVVFANGAFQNVYSAFPRTDGGELLPDERLAFARMGNIFYWSYVGSILVSGGLFVNAIFSLLDYIAVGEGAHYQ